MRQFCPGWFKGQHSKWLEYSISNDAAYCFYCYLFKNEHESHGNTGDAFTKNGFKAWNKAIERFKAHVGEVNSIHKYFNRMLDLMNQSQSIRTSFDKQSEKEKSESRRRLSSSIDVTRFILRLSLPFRGHDESQYSTNRGVFLELLQWYGDIDRDIGSIILENAPRNEMMCSRSIQKDIVDVCAKEIIKAIIEDLDGDFFGILVDESKDISHKDQILLDLLREHQAEKLEELLKSGEVHTGRGLNQERGLQRLGDTRWGSHYKTLDNLIVLFPSIIHVLEFTARECPNYADRIVIESLMGKIKEFDFAFMLHLMLKVLTMTNELTFALQRMDQDIVNVMGLLALTKQQLQSMRNSEFGFLMEDVSSFCDKHDIIIPKIDASYFPGKSKRRALEVTYSHYLCVDIFYAVIDLYFQELNCRFDVVSTDLLLSMASLNSINSFGNFDTNGIMRLAEYYPNEFDSIKLRDLSCQLDSL
ncbi:uncharacterized protein [Nicotiana tomentosiformis]|uniref:uncharacterized protein n=1 Tax=Nicotiana tomentosiformis TaxID=4098 RepID=UPI00388C39A1